MTAEFKTLVQLSQEGAFEQLAANAKGLIDIPINSIGSTTISDQAVIGVVAAIIVGIIFLPFGATQASIKACQSDVKHEVFNVGSGGTYSINRLVELLGGCVVNIPERPGEPKCTFADISKITNVLEWRPRISFESGIEIMLDNIDDWTDAPVWEKNDIVDATASWFKYLDR